jgi:hypothetical protein
MSHASIRVTSASEPATAAARAVAGLSTQNVAADRFMVRSFLTDLAGHLRSIS